MEGINTKYCRRCHNIKSLDEFHNDKSRKCGKAVRCKECVKKKNMTLYNIKKMKKLQVIAMEKVD